MPITFISESLARANKTYQNKANIESVPLAHIATAAYSFAGAKDLKIDEFLPYPLEGKTDILTKQTCLTFIELLDKDLIPEKIVGSLGKYLPLINQYS